ncbi:murein L,D-transpeptidase catalytic domain family protein [Namhaeicola litoreus]|uniref:Murein L,D-transpeptidase catalytic domain family protein n=1 Tax=Namhaeicola litoreus TaxID=1052145 RepID=A0ABW3Y7W4_9FLAO
MKYVKFLVVLLLLSSFFSFKSSNISIKKQDKAIALITISKPGIKDLVLSFYQKLNDPDLNLDAFEKAYKGYLLLLQDKKVENENYLTVVDMSASANQTRFFVIDIKNEKIVDKSMVAHGRNSGSEFAKAFSNKIGSYQTSLGFYKTAELYTGKHGLSLRLDGLENSNSNARARAIVIHAADYVSELFVKRNGRLGRSLGCPSLPPDQFKPIIQKIKEGSILFIYHPTKSYLSGSKIINTPESFLRKLNV